MDYAAVRSRIKTGDLLLFRSHGLAGWFIRFWTGSEFAHSGVAFWVGSRLFVLEARKKGGVQLNPLSNRLKDHASWCSWGKQIDEEFALSKVGVVPYSTLDAIRAGLGFRTRAGGYECAELVAELVGMPSNEGWVPKSLAFYGETKAHVLPITVP